MKNLFFALAALCGLLAIGCPDPGKSSPGIVDLTADLTGLTADGSAAQTTTKLTLAFDKDITGLAAGDITLGGNTGAAAGTLTRTGRGTYELTITGISQGGTVTVSVYKTGYILNGSPKQVTVYYSSAGSTQAAFTGLFADGSATQTTTKLSLAFDKDVPSLTAADLTLNAGSTGAAAGTLSRTGTGIYELALSGISSSGTVTVAVGKSGYNISGSPRQVTVYYNNGEPLTQAAFTGLFADGSATQTTAKLSLTFDKDITSLAAGNIALGGTTGAVAGTLTTTGTGTYELALSGISQGGTITVTVAKSGYEISGSTQQVMVYYYNGGTLIQAAFTGLTADGSATETTTKLSLTFYIDITGLTAADLTLDAGSTGAMAETLTRTGTGTYDLALKGISQSGTVKVTVAKSGYDISGGSRQVTVYYYNGGSLTQAAFTGLTADDSATETTTKLSLTFDKDITGLAAGDITLGGSTGATAETLTRTGVGAYELTITGITQGGIVMVTVAKSGYNISGSQKEIMVYYYSTRAAFTGLTADGSATQTTTKLSLAFDKDITGLTAEDLTLNAGSTGAAAGTLTRTGTGTYELTIRGIMQGGLVTVTVAKSGYNISGGPKSVTVNYYNSSTGDIQAAFTGLTADGSDTETTTKLSLTFDKDITGLATWNIALGGSTWATAGTLTRTGTGTYELTISGITQGGAVTVTVAKSGYDISGSQKEIMVYYYSTRVAFTGLTADGSETQTTTKLSLTFDRDIPGLTAEDLTLRAYP